MENARKRLYALEVLLHQYDGLYRSLIAEQYSWEMAKARPQVVEEIIKDTELFGRRYSNALWQVEQAEKIIEQITGIIGIDEARRAYGELSTVLSAYDRTEEEIRIRTFVHPTLLEVMAQHPETNAEKDVAELQKSVDGGGELVEYLETLEQILDEISDSVQLNRPDSEAAR